MLSVLLCCREVSRRGGVLLPLYGREQGSIVRGIKSFPAIFECDLAFNLTDECSLQT